MKLGIAAKADEPHRAKIARYVFDYLKGRSDVVVQHDLAKHFDGEARPVPVEDMDVDVLITVGGDGTILHAMQRNAAPVFGINVGDLGFLTECDPIELPDALDVVLNGEYRIETRLKIDSRVNDERLPDAVNEAVVKTLRPSKILHMDVAVDGRVVHRVRADGLIVGTPTGSTSYAMSAGGPIVDPRVDCFILVPIAAFSLASRPLVVPTSSTIEVTLTDPLKEGIVVVDGQHERTVGPEDRLSFRASAERARFVRFRSDFYERLTERLGHV